MLRETNQPPSENDGLLDQIAEAFLSELRHGRDPNINDYTSRHPELADEIRETLATLAMLEQACDGANETDQLSHAQVQIPNSLGSYRIIRELGRGGMGIVYEAEHDTMRRRVALKVLPREAALRARQLQRFHREARAAGRLHHSNIVPVFEVGQSDGYHFYAMQYIQGQSLDVVFEDLKRLQSERLIRPTPAICDTTDDCAISSVSSAEGSTRLVVSESGSITDSSGSRIAYFRRIGRIGLQVAEALSYAHGQGVLHRDIKPANLILDAGGIMWITDFGLAKHDDETITRSGDLVGTLRYMAPERFEGTADARGDIYGLGLTLYELCTLTEPFMQRDRSQLIRQLTKVDPIAPRKLDPQIPRDLETIILKSIDKQPSHRYQNASAVADDLRLFLSDRPIEARRASLRERTWRWCRRNPALAWLSATVALLIATLLVGSLLFASHSLRYARTLEEKTQQATTASHKAIVSERKARRRLYDYCLSQVEAVRWSGRPGQRFQGLEMINRALDILPTLDLSELELAQDRLRLRNDAIACLARPDVELRPSWKAADLSEFSAVFDSTFTRYAQANEQGDVSIHRANDRRQLAVLPGSGTPAVAMAFSPDNRYVGVYYLSPSAKYDSESDEPIEARVWDLSTNKPIIEVADNLYFGPFAFSADCTRFVLCMKNHEIGVYELPIGQLQRTLPGTVATRTVQLDPSGHRLAVTGNTNNEIQVWDIDNEQYKAAPTPDRINVVAWHPDGHSIAGACENGNIYIWDAQQLDHAPQVLRGHAFDTNCVFYNHRGNRLLSYSWDSTARLWDAHSLSELLRIDNVRFNCAGFGRDDRRVGYIDGKDVGILHFADEDVHRVLRAPESNARTTACWHPAVPGLACSVTGRGVEIWNVDQGRVIETLAMEGCVSAIFSSDGSWLLTNGKQGVQRFRAQFDQSMKMLVFDQPETVAERPTAAISLANSRTLAFCQDGAVKVCDIEASISPRTLGEHPMADSLATSRDGKWVVSSTWSSGEGILVWNIQDSSLNHTLPTVDQAARCEFSPGGQLLCVINGPSQRIYQVGSWELLHESGKEDFWPAQPAFSPDGSLVAVLHSNQIIRLVDPRTGAILAKLEPPVLDRIRSMSFRPEGTQLLAVVGDTIHVWDLRAMRIQLAKLNLDFPH